MRASWLKAGYPREWDSGVYRPVWPNWISKEVRDRLSIDSDSEFEVGVEGHLIVLMPRRVAGRQVVEADGWPVIEAIDGSSRLPTVMFSSGVMATNADRHSVDASVAVAALDIGHAPTPSVQRKLGCLWSR